MSAKHFKWYSDSIYLSILFLFIFFIVETKTSSHKFMCILVVIYELGESEQSIINTDLRCHSWRRWLLLNQFRLVSVERSHKGLCSGLVSSTALKLAIGGGIFVRCGPLLSLLWNSLNYTWGARYQNWQQSLEPGLRVAHCHRTTANLCEYRTISCPFGVGVHFGTPSYCSTEESSL